MKKWMMAALALMLAPMAPVGAQTLPGEPIHSFDLMDLNGTFHSPAQYKGKILGIFLLGHD